MKNLLFLLNLGMGMVVLLSALITLGTGIGFIICSISIFTQGLSIWWSVLLFLGLSFEIVGLSFEIACWLSLTDKVLDLEEKI